MREAESIPNERAVEERWNFVTTGDLGKRGKVLQNSSCLGLPAL
jgi:hypothetical protein